MLERERESSREKQMGVHRGGSVGGEGMELDLAFETSNSPTLTRWGVTLSLSLSLYIYIYKSSHSSPQFFFLFRNI